MSMFPADGIPKKGTIGPADEKDFQTAEYSALHVPLELPANASNFVKRWLGWLWGDTKPTYTRGPMPRPEGGYSRNGVDSRILNGAIAYANAARDTLGHGYNLVMPPRREMLRRFKNAYGYEKSENGEETAYVSRDLKPAKAADVLSHEILAKRLRIEKGMDHEDLHPVVEAYQGAMVEAYARGEEGVLDRFTKLALDALRN